MSRTDYLHVIDTGLAMSLAQFSFGSFVTNRERVFMKLDFKSVARIEIPILVPLLRMIGNSQKLARSIALDAGVLKESIHQFSCATLTVLSEFHHDSNTRIDPIQSTLYD